VTTGDAVVIAYYALVVGEVDHDDATEQAREGLSTRFPIPIAILARLAVDRRHQRQGLGAALLDDAVRRVLVAAEQVAVRAIVFHAADKTAAAFSQRFGFRTLGTTPPTLMVTLAELRAAGYP